jgi:hypothetical protein
MTIRTFLVDGGKEKQRDQSVVRKKIAEIEDVENASGKAEERPEKETDKFARKVSPRPTRRVQVIPERDCKSGTASILRERPPEKVMRLNGWAFVFCDVYAMISGNDGAFGFFGLSPEFFIIESARNSAHFRERNPHS